MELAESRREVAMMMITNAGWRNRLAYNRWRLLTCLILLVVAGAIVTTNAQQGKAQQGANGSTSFSEQVSNEELQVLGTHISPMINAGFTADGKWIVVAGTDGVTLHDAATSRCVHWFNGQLVEVAPDGKVYPRRTLQRSTRAVVDSRSETHLAASTGCSSQGHAFQRRLTIYRLRISRPVPHRNTRSYTSRTERLLL